MVSIPRCFSFFLGFSHCFTLFPLDHLIWVHHLCVQKGIKSNLISTAPQDRFPEKAQRPRKSSRKPKTRTKNEQTTLVLFRKRGPSPRPLRISFLFLLFSPLRFLFSWVFCWFCIVSFFAAFPMIFSAFCHNCCLYFGCWKANDALADSTCSCQWKIVIQCKDAFYVNRCTLSSLNFRGGSCFSLYKKYFRSPLETLCTSYTR